MAEQMGEVIKLPADPRKRELVKLKNLKLEKDDGKFVGETNKGKVIGMSDLKKIKEKKDREEFDEKFSELKISVHNLMFPGDPEGDDINYGISFKDEENDEAYLRKFNLFNCLTKEEKEEKIAKVKGLTNDKIIKEVMSYKKNMSIAELFYYSNLIDKAIERGLTFSPSHD
jgi:hypothetical protein